MAAFAELLGPKLRHAGKPEDGDTPALLEKATTAVGLYFANASCAEFTATLTQAYSGALAEKGLEVVCISMDESEEAMNTACKDMPWLAMPFAAGQRDALLEQFEIADDDLPQLRILGTEAQLLTANGVERVTADPNGDEFPWTEETGPPTLSENEILIRMGDCAPEPGLAGLKGIFFNSKNYPKYGMVDQLEEDDNVHFCAFTLKPYVLIAKSICTQEVAKMGFASDFHAHQKDIEKFPGPELLVLLDQERTYGEKLVFCTTQAAFDREWARLEERRKEVIDAFEAEIASALAAEGGEAGGDLDLAAAEDDNIDVVDGPKDCGEWVSETMEATHAEVSNFEVHNARPLMQVMISRPRASFGKTCKFSDSGENCQNCRPQKDPNFALQRKELEYGVQAVKPMKTSSCQTSWFRPVNKSTQYSPADFLQNDSALDAVLNKVDELSNFLQSVSVPVEEALQTNETVDIFQEEFAHLGEEDAGAVAKTHTNIKEFRNFHDMAYMMGQRIECIEWVPKSVDMLACSMYKNLPFNDRLECTGKAITSNILLWSLNEYMTPHAVLVAPFEVPVFKFWPSDPKFVVGGLSNGQLAIWKLSDADLGYALPDKSGGAAHEEDKGVKIPEIQHKHVSVIDESHRKACMAIEWLPPAFEIERRGRGASEKNPKDGPVKYFLTLAGDGQLMIWDIQAILDAINDKDYFWRPVYRVQLQRQDSGTEMGCQHLIYCRDRYDDKENKLLTCFYASTEEGELILGDWAAKVEEDRKPEICRKMFAVSKTFRPMLSLEISPFFPDIILGVTDWAFYLWKDGLKEHLFQSSYTSPWFFTAGVWSPTRPSVIFLSLANGGIDIWDFSDQSHKASLTDHGASVAISAMSFLKTGDMHGEQKLAVGDASGHLHVHTIPKNLVRQAGKELDNMRKFLEQEETRVLYFRERRKELSELKDQLEKQAQMAMDKEEDKSKATVDNDKLDAAAEEVYRKLEEECKEELKLQGASF